MSAPLVKKLALQVEKSPFAAFAEPVLMCALLLAVTAFLVGGSFNPFLYFRF